MSYRAAPPWKSRDLDFSPSSAHYSLELWRAEWDVLPVQAALKSVTVTHHVKASYKWHLHYTQIFEPVLSEITRCLKNSISLLPHYFLSPVIVLSVKRWRPIFECRHEKIGFLASCRHKFLHAVDQIIWFHEFWLPRRQWGAVNRYIHVNPFILQYFLVCILIIFGTFFFFSSGSNALKPILGFCKNSKSLLLRDWDAFTCALISHLIYHSCR